MPGLLPLFRRDGDGRETITTAYLPLEANYSTHMPNEKPRRFGRVPGLQSLRSWIGLGGAGLGVTYPTAVFNVRGSQSFPLRGAVHQRQAANSEGAPLKADARVITATVVI